MKANAAIVPAGINAGVNVYVTNTTDVVMDIDGFFAPAAHPHCSFIRCTPCRVADTRSSSILPQGLGTPAPLCGVRATFRYSTRAHVFPQESRQRIFPELHRDTLSHWEISWAYLEVWPKGPQPTRPVSTLNNPTGRCGECGHRACGPDARSRPIVR